MTARCKFKVTEVTHYAWGSARKILLKAEYDSTLAEDVSFTKATPTGSMEVVIDNPSAFDTFAVGTYVYVDVTPIKAVEK